MPTAEENQAAAKDPRVGDRWKCNARGSDWLATVTARDNAKAKAKYTLERDGGKPIEYERTLKDFTSSIYASGWELIERGPAPAAEKPERDPRIDPVFGDELKCTEGHTREVGEVGKNGQGYECVWYDQYTPGGNRYIREACSLGEWREINRGAEILAYGDRPAPDAEAKPERDPYTQPVVGDEWAKDGECIRVILLSSDARVIQQLENERGQTTKWSTPVKDWPTWVDGWHLHRRGDDPSWRPATNTDDTGDEQPTPAFEGDPNEERFTTVHAGDKYVRTIYPRYSGQPPIQVDVYNVLDAYSVPAGPLHHAAKKILCAGIRGHKGAEQDLTEARDAITRAIEMLRQKGTA